MLNFPEFWDRSRKFPEHAAPKEVFINLINNYNNTGQNFNFFTLVVRLVLHRNNKFFYLQNIEETP